MTHIEALKLALEALEDNFDIWTAKTKAITAIKEALAQPDYRAVKTYHEGKPVHVAQPQQEPLEYWNAVEGWVKLEEAREHLDSVGCGTIYKTAGEGRVPLCIAQPQQEPVAWISHNAGLYHFKPDESLNPLPLYLAPPPCPTCKALARTVMLDQTSHDTTPQRDFESTTDMMMELVDRLGELPDDIDPRAWDHLLVYAPKRKPLKWQQAPVKTQWGDDMVVASLAIDKDHTVCLYCEREQTPKVEAMFAQRTWAGLTEEEVKAFDTWHDNREEEVGWCNPSEIVAYIEAKLRSKNNG